MTKNEILHEESKNIQEESEELVSFSPASVLSVPHAQEDTQPHGS